MQQDRLKLNWTWRYLLHSLDCLQLYLMRARIGEDLGSEFTVVKIRKLIVETKVELVNNRREYWRLSKRMRRAYKDLGRMME